ncbi:MAG: DNA repair protein RecN [Spirochaetes bacterium]|nr:DNA repair protein RecN [Spirochaetota bacterium]
MLEYLRVRNYTLIEDIRINFSKGFNILSGETGAGKSIIIGAIGGILGERLESNSIRTGEDKAIIEATFDIKSNYDAARILEDSGIDFDIREGVIIRRELSSDGRNKNYINATPVPLAKVKEFGNTLVDIHGQHEHQTLLKINRHIEFLDKFGHLEKEGEEIATEFKVYLDLKNKLEKLQMNEQEKKRLVDLLNFSINEIETADLKKGEDVELEKEYLVLSNQEKISDAIEKGYFNLYDKEDSVYTQMQNTITSLSEVEKFDPEIVNLKQVLEESFYQIEDVMTNLREYKLKFDFSPQRLDEIIERIDLMNRLKKKYAAEAGSIEEILSYKEKSIQDLNTIEQSEEEIEKTKKLIKDIQAKLSSLAVHLSGRRRVVAKLLEEKVEEQLKDLDMAKTIFKVDIKYQEEEKGIALVEGKRYKVTEKGMDNIEFLIAPNVGESLKPLRKIASGGEMSRIMLALKTILNEVDKIETMIFDEIDAGIGGKTSDMVGRKLKFLGGHNQVICITHQPQIARYADVHFVVNKSVEGERTVTRLKQVKGEERVSEIARMLGGEKITHTTLQHAKELLVK